MLTENGKGEYLKGVKRPKWGTPMEGMHWDAPLNVNLNINNENWD
jgi:hypothetical protein